MTSGEKVSCFFFIMKKSTSALQFFTFAFSSGYDWCVGAYVDVELQFENHV